MAQVRPRRPQAVSPGFPSAAAPGSRAREEPQPGRNFPAGAVTTYFRDGLKEGASGTDF